MTARSLDVELFSRPGCHLCEEMKANLQAAARGLEMDLREVDVSKDEELERRFGGDVPVLFVNGRRAFQHRASEDELRRRLLDELRPRGIGPGS